MLGIVQSIDSLSAAWWELLQRYRACGLKEKSRLTQELDSLKMELREDPKKFTMRMDRVARELRRVGKAFADKNKNLAILNGLTQEYAVERQMLEGGDDEPTRRVILNQYGRLRAETSETGAKALAVAATPGQDKP